MKKRGLPPTSKRRHGSERTTFLKIGRSANDSLRDRRTNARWGQVEQALGVLWW